MEANVLYDESVSRIKTHSSILFHCQVLQVSKNKNSLMIRLSSMILVDGADDLATDFATLLLYCYLSMFIHTKPPMTSFFHNCLSTWCGFGFPFSSRWWWWRRDDDANMMIMKTLFFLFYLLVSISSTKICVSRENQVSALTQWLQLGWRCLIRFCWYLREIWRFVASTWTKNVGKRMQ